MIIYYTLIFQLHRSIIRSNAYFFYRANQNNDAQYTYWPLFLFMVYLTTDMNLALNEIEKSFGKNLKIFFVFIYWKNKYDFVNEICQIY